MRPRRAQGTSSRLNAAFHSSLTGQTACFILFECADRPPGLSRSGSSRSVPRIRATRRKAMTTSQFAAGGYRYIPAVFQYSGGVGALPGFEIQRARFKDPVPLVQGFERIERFITAAGRPLTAFCACELRSPAPFTEDGFRAFNEIYAGTLRKWGVMAGDTNPVARSNVCPEIDAPAEPSFHAFAFTVAASSATPTF